MNEPTIMQLKNLVLLANGHTQEQASRIRQVSVQSISQSFCAVKGRILSLAVGCGVDISNHPNGEKCPRHWDGGLLECKIIASIASELGYLSHVKLGNGSDAYAVDPQYATLTDRRRQILIGIANGDTFAAIARRLTLSVNTVKTHAVNLRDDLGAYNSAHAVAIAFSQGIISSEDIREQVLT